MKMPPILHVLLRTALTGAIAYGIKFYALTQDIWLPLGLTVNIGLGVFFLLFWIWPFPWGDVMLLGPLEQAQRKLLPHGRLLASPLNCTVDACVLAGTNSGKCVKMRHMRDQTRKRMERLDDAVFRSGAPYFLAIVGLVIVAGLTRGLGTAPTVFVLWQAIQVLLGLLSITWWAAMIYGEVSYQRSLNFDLLF